MTARSLAFKSGDIDDELDDQISSACICVLAAEWLKLGSTYLVAGPLLFESRSSQDITKRSLDTVVAACMALKYFFVLCRWILWTIRWPRTACTAQAFFFLSGNQ